LGASQPQRSGVRFGKCQLNKNVKCASERAAISRLMASEPTVLRTAASGPSSPSEEKSSQNRSGPTGHPVPPRQPRRYVTRASEASSAANTNEPASGSVFDKKGFSIVSPWIPSLDRKRFERPSFPTGL